MVRVKFGNFVELLFARSPFKYFGMYILLVLEQFPASEIMLYVSPDIAIRCVSISPKYLFCPSEESKDQHIEVCTEVPVCICSFP